MEKGFKMQGDCFVLCVAAIKKECAQCTRKREEKENRENDEYEVAKKYFHHMQSIN